MKKYVVWLLLMVSALGWVAPSQAQQGPAPESAETLSVGVGGLCDTETLPLVEEGVPTGENLRAPAAGPTTRVSVRSDGGQSSGGDNYAPHISADGRYVVFESDAKNLLSAGNDTNDKRDIFWHDRQTGITERVSVGDHEEEANGDNCAPAVSDDGRYIVFTSFADNLVDNDNNLYPDIFLRDRQSGTTILVSKANGGQLGNSSSHDADISSDGRFIAFWSYAYNLVPNDTNAKTDVFRYDRVNNTIERLSVDTNEVQGNGHSSHPSISADGTRIAFESEASNLVTGDGGGYKDIFVRNTNTTNTLRISFSSSGGDPAGDSWAANISADGLYVVFVSFGTNLVSNDTNNQPDVFLRDRNTDVTHRVSIATDGTQANNWCEEPTVSADGRYVTFQYYATNLVAGDVADTRDVFIRDRQANTLIRASISTAGEVGNASSREPVITGDGRYVVFSSKASTLVANDTNEDRDIFVHDTYSPPPPPSLTISHTTGQPGSVFTVTGANFTANSTATVVINNVAIGSLSTNSTGGFVFDVATVSTTDEGAYVVTVTVGITVKSVVFLLHSFYPPRTGTGGLTFFVPDGIALDQPVYLPIVRRN